MKEPNYVLKMNEAAIVPVKQSRGANVLRIGIWCTLGVVILGSIIFQDNLFDELNWSAKLLLIALVLFAIKGEKKEDVPSPMEIQFYDDHLIVFRPKRFYNKKVTRKEINKMKYDDISKCVLKTRVQRLHIYGNLEAKWFDYGKDGEIPTQPTYNRFVTETFCYMSTMFATDIDFKQEIEAHSPIKVIVEE